jgi:metallo-beta-lactamase family protein
LQGRDWKERQFAASLNYGMGIKISDNLAVKLMNAGYVPGSACFIFTIDNKKSFVSRVDLGSGYLRFNGEFDIPGKVDLIFMEATYAKCQHKFAWSNANFSKTI